MMAETLQALAAQFAATMMHFLWQGLVIAAVAATLVALFGRNSPRASYRIHCVAMLLMLCCLPLTWVVLTERPSETLAAPVAATTTAPITESEPATSTSVPAVAVTPVVAENVAPPVARSGVVG